MQVSPTAAGVGRDARARPRSAGRCAVARQQQRPVEVDPVGVLGEQHGRRHGQRGRHHAADHDLEAARARRGGQRQRLGEPAGLVELDVDGVVAPGERGEVGAVVHDSSAHIGTGRDAGERRIGARRQRLLDQLDAGLGGDAPSARAAAPASRPRWRRRPGARAGQRGADLAQARARRPRRRA